MAAVDHMRGANVANLAAMEQTRMLANTLAQNGDPKFQVCMLLSQLLCFSCFFFCCCLKWWPKAQESCVLLLYMCIYIYIST